MNKYRRDLLKVAIDYIEKAKEIVDVCSEEEQTYADNMPDNLQQSINCERANDVADELSQAEDILNDVAEMLNSAIE